MTLHATRLRAALLLVALLSLPALAMAQTTQPTTAPSRSADPPYRTGLTMRDFPARDPFIVAHEPTKTYYLYITADIERDPRRAGVVAYRSKDLKIWEGPQVVFRVPDATWANPEHGAWAPEVHEYNGKYYLFVTLHNNDSMLARPPEVWRVNHMRGTVIAEADTPDGPFTLLRTDRPHTPPNFMTLDGTLYVDPEGQPWMVYAHEWIQIIDGTFEAIRLTEDLTDTIGEPIYLFKGSDGVWLRSQEEVSAKERSYVTDGCQLYRTREGELIMLWASHSANGYLQTAARSTTGTLQGPWEQLDVLVGNDSGHGMLFRTFDGQLMLVLHQPFGAGARTNLYEMEDTGDRFRIVRPRPDLDNRRPVEVPSRDD